MGNEMMKIAVWISGGGTTLGNILDCVSAGLLDVDVRLVVSSRSDVGGIEVARASAIETQVVLKSLFISPAGYSEEMFRRCRELAVDYVVMAGFLKHVLIPQDFTNRVVNIHPSLIPAFCGKGMYGSRVHQAVVESGVTESGCTIHFVDNEFDHGPIIYQQAVDVDAGDIEEDVRARVFAAECEAYPKVLRWLAAGRISVAGSVVTVQR
jgi:phosphoribosylglycinamide formyltransferase-1